MGRLPLLIYCPSSRGCPSGGLSPSALKEAMAGWQVGRSDFGTAGTIFVCVTASLNMAFFLRAATPSSIAAVPFGVEVRSCALERLAAAAFADPISRCPTITRPSLIWRQPHRRLRLDVLVARFGPVFLGGSAAAMASAAGCSACPGGWRLPVVCVFWIVATPDVTLPGISCCWSQSDHVAVSAFVIFSSPSPSSWRTARYPGLPLYPQRRAPDLSFPLSARGICTPILICAAAATAGRVVAQRASPAIMSRI